MIERPELTSTDAIVQVAGSTDRITRRAVQQILHDLSAAEAAFTFIFFGPEHDAVAIAEELAATVGGRGVAGSTAGELSPQGFSKGGMVGMSLRGPTARVSLRVLHEFADFSLVRVSSLAEELARSMALTTAQLDPHKHSWLLLLDGLSNREDLFTPFFATHAPRLPLVGGSLGDDTTYRKTTLVFDGEVHHGASAVMLLEYDRPFRAINHTHVVFTDTWFEVTAAERGGRILTQLNGRPALDVYAEALGLRTEDVTEKVTASSPLGFRFRGRPFPCSVAASADPLGLAISQSIQTGERVALLRSEGLVTKTRDDIAENIEALKEAGGTPMGMLAFSCVMRHIEATYDDSADELFEAMNQLPIAGFNTYGEQFGSRHLSHTLCGLMFG